MKRPEIYLFIYNCDDTQLLPNSYTAKITSCKAKITKEDGIILSQKKKKKRITKATPHQQPKTQNETNREVKQTERKFVVKATILLINQLSQKFNAFDAIRTKNTCIPILFYIYIYMSVCVC